VKVFLITDVVSQKKKGMDTSTAMNMATNTVTSTTTSTSMARSQAAAEVVATVAMVDLAAGK
jgi:hypothetical protein